MYGQALVEYALIITLVIISFGVALAATGPALGNIFCEVAFSLVQSTASSQSQRATFDNGCVLLVEDDGAGGVVRAELPSADDFWLTVTWVSQQNPGVVVLPTNTLPPPTAGGGSGPEILPTDVIPTATPTATWTPSPSPTPQDYNFTAPWHDSADDAVFWRLDSTFYTGSEDWYGIYYGNRSLTAPATQALYNNEINEAYRGKIDFDWADQAPIADFVENDFSVSWRKPIWVNPDRYDKVTLNIDVPKVDDGLRIWIIGEAFGGNPDVRTGGPADCSSTGVQPGGEGLTGSTWTVYDDDHFGYNPDTDAAADAPTECLIVDKWNHGSGTQSLMGIRRTVPAGFYTIQVDYYDELGDANIKVDISSATDRINPDDTRINTSGAPVTGLPLCGWYNRSDGEMPNSLDYMWDEFQDGAELSAGNRCYLELRGSVYVPAETANPRLTFWDVWDLSPGVSTWVEVGDYSAYEATGDRSSLAWERFDLHSGDTYNYNWTYQTVDLSTYVDKKVALRFGIENRTSTSTNRWYIDSISIASAPRETYFMSQRWSLDDESQKDDFVTSGQWALVSERTLGAGMGWHESPSRDISRFIEYRTAGADTNADVRVHSLEFNGVIDLTDPNGINDLEGDSGEPVLTFWHQYDLEDFIGLEIQYTTQGVTTDPNAMYGAGEALNWQPVPSGGVIVPRNSTGASLDTMTFVQVPLNSIGADQFRLRFAMVVRNDATANGSDGWWIDEIQLERDGPPKFTPYPFFDDVEDVATYRNWTPLGAWDRVSGGRRPAIDSNGYAWTDSPAGDYSENSDTSLVLTGPLDLFNDTPNNPRSPACSLGAECETPGITPDWPMMEFYWWRDLSNGENFFVEWKRVDEADTEWRYLWSYLDRMTTVGEGNDNETRAQYAWERAEVDLQPVKDVLTNDDDIAIATDDDILIRFRFATNGRDNDDGVYIDDIRIQERELKIWHLWPSGQTAPDVNGNPVQNFDGTNATGNGTVYFDGVDANPELYLGDWHFGGDWQPINWEQRAGTLAFHDSPTGQQMAPPDNSGDQRVTDYATRNNTFSVLEMGTWIDLRGVDASERPYLSFWSRWAQNRNNHRARVEVSYYDPTLGDLCRGNHPQCYEKNYEWSEWEEVWIERNSRTYTWQLQRIDLSEFAKNGVTSGSPGRLIRIRFSMDALRAVDTPYDGWYIDEIRLGYFDPMTVTIDKTSGFFDGGSNLTNWIPEGIWGISQTFGRGEAAGVMPVLIWTEEFRDFSSGCSSFPACIDDYFSDNPIPTDMTEPFVRQVTTIDYNWGGSGPSDGGTTLTNRFAGRWETVTPVLATGQDGLYRFAARADDGVRMRYEVASGGCTLPTSPTPDNPLDGSYWNIINRWSYSSSTEYGAARLEAGCSYRLILWYYENRGGADISLNIGGFGNTSFTDSPETGPDENQEVGAVQRSNSSLIFNGVFDLTGATNPILEYYTYHELGGTARVELSTDGGFTWAPLPGDSNYNSLEGATPEQMGLWDGNWSADVWDYRTDMDFDSGRNEPDPGDYPPTVTGVDAGNRLWFNWGNGSIPDGEFPGTTATWGNDVLSIRFTRDIVISEPMTFRFFANSDDGVRVWINYDPSDPNCALDGDGWTVYSGARTGKNNRVYGDEWPDDLCMVIDDYVDQGSGSNLNVVRTLPAGRHTIQVDWYENGGNASLEFEMYRALPGDTPSDTFDDPSYSGNNNMPDDPEDIPDDWDRKRHDLSAYVGQVVGLRFRLDRLNSTGPDEGNDFNSRNQNPFNWLESWWITDISVVDP